MNHFKIRLQTLYHWLAGRHPVVRRHTLFSLSTGHFYAVTIGVMYQAASFGLVPWQAAHVLTICMVANFTFFCVLVRSGWTQRFADPVLTLPHSMVSELITIAAYVMVGAERGDVVLLMGQIIGISMFRLKPRGSLFLGLWTVGWLLAAQAALIHQHAEGFDGARALSHMLLSACGLLAMSVVGMWISDIRARIARQSQKLRATLTQAQVLATTDMLTGLLNRRRMGQSLDEHLQQAIRSGRPLCAALIDLDHFKRINDVHGHRVGDDVLKTFAALAQGELRAVDQLARWGGEEFLVLLPDLNHQEARLTVERLCRRIAAHPMGASCQLNVTVSVGLAQWWPGESLICWLDRADKALYEAKRQGRNRCLVADADGLNSEADDLQQHDRRPVVRAALPTAP